MAISDIEALRRHAIAHSLFAPTTLAAAIDRLGFVQADPIRAPARAQDLILRQRVAGYRAGDLEVRYPSLEIDEGYFFLYGFFPRATWSLIHPRARSAASPLERKVLGHLRERGPVHPSELAATFGTKRVINAWGGQSKATTEALDRLHFRGQVRIARRDNGVRVYEILEPTANIRTAAERLRRLTLVFANLLAPVSARTLQKIFLRLARSIAPTIEAATSVRAMIAAGDLDAANVDGTAYVWPAGTASMMEAQQSRSDAVDDDRVRFLAPFDPVVWDRNRFEQLWGWAYRFEAYTPPAKRVRGYYAMPLLWRGHAIGWANVAVANGTLDVELGFARTRPKERAFASALDIEVEALRAFLGLDG